MPSKRLYHGGLQFNGDSSGALERFCKVVKTTLEDYGHLVERETLLTKCEASIVTSQYLIRLTLESNDRQTNRDRFEQVDRAAGLKTKTRPPVTRPRNRMAISISPVSTLLDDSEMSELMLVVILYRMVDICSTQWVEWLSPNTVLTLEQFMGAFDSIAPRKSRDFKHIFETVSGPFAGMESSEDQVLQLTSDAPKARPIQLTDEQLLSIAFRTDPEPPFVTKTAKVETEDGNRPSDILRLTSWGMTGCVASVSAPVAISLAAVNLIRGEDFRLNTQVLAYTAAIFCLNTSNAFADVASALGM